MLSIELLIAPIYAWWTLHCSQSHVGYLGGSEDYYQATLNQHDFWHDDHPGSDVVNQVHYR